MIVIILSVIALAAGPILHGLARQARSALEALDGFVFVVVGGLVLLAFAPRAIAGAGTAGLAAVVAGFGALALAERFTGHALDRALWPLAVLALGFHEFVDGLALAGWQSAGHQDALLPAAIVIHRIPVGIALWWLVAPEHGVRRAAVALALVAAATVAGYAFGRGLTSQFTGVPAGLIQGFIAGAFLHALLHRAGGHAEGDGAWALPAGIGALVGLALLVALHENEVPAVGVPGHLDAGVTFMTLALAAAPFLLVACALELFAPRGPPFLSAEAMLVSVPLLGAPLTVARILAGLGIGLGLGRALRTEPLPSGTPWMLAGLGVACVIEPLVDPQWLEALPAAAWVVVAALAGLPAYISAGAATPIVAVLLHKGLSPGAGLAFLLTAPIPVAALARRQGARGMVLAACAAGAACVAGYLVDQLFPATPFPLHELAAERPGALSVGSLVGLAVVIALSLLKLGPRGYVAQVFRKHTG